MKREDGHYKIDDHFLYRIWYLKQLMYLSYFNNWTSGMSIFFKIFFTNTYGNEFLHDWANSVGSVPIVIVKYSTVNFIKTNQQKRKICNNSTGLPKPDGTAGVKRIFLSSQSKKKTNSTHPIFEIWFETFVLCIQFSKKMCGFDSH